MLPDWKGEKLMRKVRKRGRYYDMITGEVNYNAMHDKSLYEVEYPDGTTEKLAANILAEIFCHKLTLKVITIKY